TFMFPIDVIKSRIQVLKPNMSTMKYAIEFVKHEGFKPLYAGLFPTLTRSFIATGALFLTYEQ
ncbi:unnamed protein product, partial [Rotaria socialis]